jgi:hypothetical protein
MITELMEMLRDVVIKNNKVPNTYVIDEIQMIILRETNEFLTYEECEEIYNSII